MTVTKNIKIVNAILAFLTKSQTFLPFLLPEASSLSDPIVNYPRLGAYVVRNDQSVYLGMRCMQAVLIFSANGER